jgi:hypothetical protein
MAEAGGVRGDVIAGGCRCGQVRYRVARSGLPKVYACHCRDCQTWSGSAFSLQCLLPEGQFAVEGETRLFELASADGQRLSRQHGCPICLTRIYNTNTARPGTVVVRAGTLDRSDALTIVAHIWTCRKMAGIEISAGIPQWDEAALAPEFLAVLSDQED